MKTPLPLLAATLFAFLIFFTSCEKAKNEPAEAPEPEPTAEKSAESTPSPADAETPSDDDIAEELAALFGDGDVSSADLSALSKDLSSEEQETLKTAVEKAMSSIDFSLLETSLKGTGGKLNLSGANVKTLTPEEVEKLGIDIQALTGGAENVQIISHSSIMTTGETTEIPEGTDAVTPQITAISTPAIVSDPAASARLMELMNSGNSEALAKELSSLIQTGLDGVALQQLGVEGEPEKAPAPSEDK